MKEKESEIDKKLREMRELFEKAHRVVENTYVYNYSSGQYEQKPPFGWGQ